MMDDARLSWNSRGQALRMVAVCALSDLGENWLGACWPSIGLTDDSCCDGC